MNAVALSALRPNTFFTKFLFTAGGFVLLAPETPVTPELINRLARWEFRELDSEGEAVESIVDTSHESVGEAADAALAKGGEGLDDAKRLEAVLAYYGRYTDFVELVYTRFVTNNELDFNELITKMKNLYELVSENKRLILRAQALAPIHKNYLVSHAVHTSIVSIILGLTIKLPAFKLIELAAAAVLHELGMVQASPSGLHGGVGR